MTSGLAGDLELVDQEVAQLVRHVGVDRDRITIAAAAPLERALEEPDQVLGLLLDLDVAVADQAEHAALDHLEAREQARSRKMSTSSSSGRKRIAGAAAGGRSARPAAAAAPAPSAAAVVLARAASGSAEKPPLGMNGNGCAGSMASGVRTGKTWSMNCWSSQRRARRRSARPARARRCRPRAARSCSSRQHVLLARPSGVDARSLIAASCSAGVRPSSLSSVERRSAAVDQAGDADHVEFVEVVGRDRQEAQPLQQRMARVAGLLEHPLVEGEPGQLAIDEASRAVGCYFEARALFRWWSN